MQKKSVFVLIALCCIALIGAGYFAWAQPASPAQTITALQASSTPSMTESTSDGTITFSHLPTFGLAVTPQQVLKSGYIPPCADGFTYCLYYDGDAYQGTNFESAGLSITKRPDIADERVCLDTPPTGYGAGVTPISTNTADVYSTSTFSPIGDAGAGHYASGSMYRLWVRSSSQCYEFQTRIGETQFANYPAGSIKEFTDSDKQAVAQQLFEQLQTVTITVGGTPTIVFPIPETKA
jgi:hypothetical protein